MAKGKIKRVPNLEKKFGANESYLFLKVQEDYSSSAEEHLLLTDDEFIDAAARGANNSEDTKKLSRGVLTLRDNTQRSCGESPHYYAVKVATADSQEAFLLFTGTGLERIRQRSERNAEDIEANLEGWLADLLD